MTKHVYKIRRKTDGLFSTGGVSPRFNEKGKTWNSRGAVSLHLVDKSNWRERVYKDCEVVRLEVIEQAVESVDVLEWQLAGSTVRAKEREEERRIEYEKSRKQREIDELERKLRKLKGK